MSYEGIIRFRHPLKFNNNHDPPAPFTKLIYGRGLPGNIG